MSKFAIFRLEKLHSLSQIKASSEHMLRSRDTANADPDRTPLNRRIIGSDVSPLAAVERRLEGVSVRKNGVRAVEVMATMSPEWAKTATAEQIDQWAATSTDWLKKQFGADNVVSLTLHMDESTPHLTGFVVPMKDGKLSAKQVVRGPQHLREMQSDYARQMEPFGLARGVEGSKAKHQTVKRFYGALAHETPEISIPKIETPPVFGREAWAQEQNERIAAALEPLDLMASDAKLSPIYRTQAKAAEATAASEKRKREEADKRAQEADARAAEATAQAKGSRFRLEQSLADGRSLHKDMEALKTRHEKELRAVETKANEAAGAAILSAMNKTEQAKAELAKERKARTDELRALDLTRVLQRLQLAQDSNDKEQWRDDERRFRITTRDNHKFYDHSASKGGGGAIDLVKHVMGYDFENAVSWLAANFDDGEVACEIRRSAPVKVQEAKATKAPFVPPPPPTPDQAVKIRAYLASRGLKFPGDLPKTLRMDQRGNVGFLTYTDSKTCVGMELKGTDPARPFTGLAVGSSRQGGFRHASGIKPGEKGDLVITESAIDALSYLQLAETSRTHPNGVMVISTAGVRETVNERLEFLLPKVDRVLIAYDNDDAGRSAGSKLKAAIEAICRVIVEIIFPPEGCKDVNDYLKKERETAPEPDYSDPDDDYDSGLTL